jgi:hypothetical protein
MFQVLPGLQVDLVLQVLQVQLVLLVLQDPQVLQVVVLQVYKDNKEILVLQGLLDLKAVVRQGLLVLLVQQVL